MIIRYVLAIVLLSSVCLDAVGQIERVLPRKGSSSLEGTSFVVGFMQNEILEVGQDPRLQIFISSQYDATVTINYPTFGPAIRRIEANTVFVEDVSPYHVVNVSEMVQQKSIFITSDVPIVVYVLNTLAASTDSYTAIPIKHLGTQYLTVNAPADRYPFNPNTENPLDTMIRASEFMVIGLENFTEVTITPRARTETGREASRPFTVRLNKGECYLVKSGHTPAGYGDQSGSRVSATAPVAVLSGHVRSSIPGSIAFSKDHLVEMLPPMQTWGKEYVTTPFSLVGGGDIIRLMAAAPNTSITIETASGGRFVTNLAGSGDWEDYRVVEPALYTSDQEFFVMQFMPSRDPWRGTSPNYDPAMVVVPPLDQYVTGALFQFPELEVQRQLGADQVFYHWINVVADSVAIPTLSVNGTLVSRLAPELPLQRIPNTTLYWASVRLPRGSYTMTADTGLFSGVMYGSTNADSYANQFGVSYDPPDLSDRTPPVYDMAVDCGNIEGFVEDISRDIPLLEEVTVHPTRTFNYRWSLSNPLDSTGKVRIEASVVDRWADGRFVVQGYDNEGNGREWLYEYDAPDIDAPESVTISSTTTETTCVLVPIVNLDSTSTTVRSIMLAADSRLTLGGGLVQDSVIGPGDTLWIEVCYTPSEETESASGSLIVDLGCGLQVPINLTTNDLAGISVENLDFGPVRVGDTACMPVPIINEGSIQIVVSSIELAADDDIQPDISGISFPVTIEPGDTLWVPVCFTPNSRGPFAREDTVINSASTTTRFTSTGIGVEPQVRSIVIDWGKRRVGVRSDTIAQLLNEGNGDCFVQTPTPTNILPEFEPSPFPINIALAASSAEPLQLSFTPSAVGPFADTIDVEVDWDRHGPVSIILMGEGIMPVFNAVNIDMGEVVVGGWKDSVVQWASSAGTEDLTITSITLIGPDDASFTLPPGTFATGTYPAGTDFGGLTRFAPSRLGPHEMQIEYLHDAAPANQQVTTRVAFRGMGVAAPVQDVDIDLQVPTPLSACVLDTVWITMTNSGNADVVVNDITVSLDGFPVSDDVTFPLILKVSEEISIGVPMILVSDVATNLDVVVVHSDTVEVRYTETFRVVGEAPDVDLLALKADHSGGGVPIIFEVSQAASRDRTEEIVVDVLVSEERWKAAGDAIVVEVTDAAGTRTVQAEATWGQTGGVIELSEPVQAPYQLSYRINGVALWKDVDPVVVAVRARENACGPVNRDEELMTVEECGGNLRAITFDALPIVEGRVTSQPATDFISIELKTTKDVSVDLDVVDVNGNRMPLARKYSLQTGVHLCNFSSMPLATGRYVVMVKHENGEFVLPLVLVK